MIRNWLPRSLNIPLFGDRKRWGQIVQENDSCWKEWTEEVYKEFYYANQKQGIGNVVNNAGYKIMSRCNFSGKKILEIGPGDISHLPYWWNNKDKPASNINYVIADIQESMLKKSAQALTQAGVPYAIKKVERYQENLPFKKDEFDSIVTFYALEHIYPLQPYLEEMKRILKPGGMIVGAIPAEGGLAWGLGRYLTTRRWFKKNTTIDPDKLICWEHPNFADYILRNLSLVFDQQYINYWPLRAPFVDLNLVISFIFRKATKEI